VGAKSERVERKLEGKLLPFFAFFFFSMVFFPFYSAWHLKATPNVELKYSSHTTCNPKNSAYLCSISHVEQSYATCLSKSLFLAEILSVEIDDFRPNLAGPAHIWPQGLIQGRLLFIFTTIVINVLLLVVFVVVVTVGDMHKERG